MRIRHNPPEECSCVHSPEDVSDYEGMKVEYTPGQQHISRVASANDVWNIMKDLGMIDDVRERVYAFYLDMKNWILGYRLIGTGAVGSAEVHPTVVFGPAQALHASQFILVHNHPSGNTKMSPQDRAFTKRFAKIASILGIRFTDSMVVGRHGYFSAVDSDPSLLQGDVTDILARNPYEPMEEEIYVPTANPPSRKEWFIRYTVNGTGLMNNQVLDRMQLTDDEEFELQELMDFGLQQPRDVPFNAIFAFTREGQQQHARLIELLTQAALGEVEEDWLESTDYEVVWRSSDGQVALLPRENNEAW